MKLTQDFYTLLSSHFLDNHGIFSIRDSLYVSGKSRRRISMNVFVDNE